MKKAILIGINDYEHGSPSLLPPLRFAEADVREFEQELRDRGGFEVVHLLGAEARRDAIEKAIWDAGSGDLLLLFFALHGETIKGEYHLHPWDSTGELKVLPVRQLIPHWPAGKGFAKVLAIIDSCRNERLGERGTRGLAAEDTRDIRSLAEQGERWVEVLYGCREGQLSYEVEEFKHGLLTHALLQVMRNRTGELDSGRLAGAAADWMRKWCRLDPRRRTQEVHRYHRPSEEERIILIPGADSSPGGEGPAKPGKGGTFELKKFPLPPLVIHPIARPAQPGRFVVLPELAPEILELEGRCAAWEEAREQLQQERHPELAPLLLAMRGADGQHRSFHAELKRREPRILSEMTPERRRQLDSAFRKELEGSLAQLCRQCPEVPEAELVGYLQFYRQAVRAEQIQEQVRKDFADAKADALEHLQQELATHKASLLQLQISDFAKVTQHLLGDVKAGAAFPQEQWIKAEEELLARRYPWGLSESLARFKIAYDQHLWECAIQAEAPDNWRNYLAVLPNGNHGDDAREKLSLWQEEASWRAAVIQNTVPGYLEYLGAYPAGAHSAIAGRRIESFGEELDWQAAEALNTHEGYAIYLAAHPKGSRVPEASQRMEALRDALDWQIALETDTLEGYNVYLAAHLQGIHVLEASRRMEALRDALDWQIALKTDTLEGYDVYLAAHPQGIHVLEASRRMEALREALAWQAAEATQTLEGNAEYLKSHPEGVHATEAKLRWEGFHEASAWQTAEKINTLEGYESYLCACPNRPHAVEAKARAYDLMHPVRARNLAAIRRLWLLLGGGLALACILSWFFANRNMALKQKVQAIEERARRLQLEQTAMQKQYQIAVSNLSAQNNELKNKTFQNILTGEGIVANVTESNKQAEWAAALKEQLSQFAESNRVAQTEIHRLNSQLLLAESEKRAVAETAVRLQEQLKAERALAQKNAANPPLTPNAVFSALATNRVDLHFDAMRLGLGGIKSSKRQDTKTVLVSNGTNIFALCHIQDTTLALSVPGTEWQSLTAALSRNYASCLAHSISFLQTDPRVVLIQVSKIEAQSLGGQVYQLAGNPFAFQEAVVVGTRDNYYGECKFQIDLSTPHYLIIDRDSLKGSFRKFNPSTGDLVLSKNGDLMGVMANNTFCLILTRLDTITTIQLGEDIRAQHTGPVLETLASVISELPSPLR